MLREYKLYDLDVWSGDPEIDENGKEYATYEINDWFFKEKIFTNDSSREAILEILVRTGYLRKDMIHLAEIEEICSSFRISDKSNGSPLFDLVRIGD